MKKVKIIGPAFPYRGGIAAGNERLAIEFKKFNYDVDIETFTLQYPSFLFPGKTQFNNKAKPEEVIINRTINSINPINWVRVGSRICNEKPDLVIIRYWLPFMAPVFGVISSLIRRNKHSIVICLADNIIPHEHRIGDNFLTGFFVKSIDGLIAMSQSVLDDSKKFRTDLPLKLCPHPIFDNYGEKIDLEKAKRILKLDSDFSYLLFFGFIREYKGLDLLIDAFADESLRKFKLKLLIAGEFYSGSEYYVDLINKHRIEKLVELRTDFIPDDQVNLYFSACDIVVQPYKSATQSGVTQIGYHFNKPMLVTNVGGLSEIIADGKIGYVVEPISGQITKAIVDFYSNNRSPVFEQNIVEEKKKFSWSNLVNSFSDMYKNIVAK